MKPAPDLNRVVAGLRCLDVLDLLPDYVDGELRAGTVDDVNAHLTECDHCERFGGQYASTVAALRGALLTDATLDAARTERLHQRLDQLWSADDGSAT